jgi:actin
MLDTDYSDIIIDNGTGMVKAGFAGNDAPEYIFPSIIGTTKYANTMYTEESNQGMYIGNDAIDKRGILKLRYPMEHGIVNNWTDMESIWKYTFDKLSVDYTLHNVMLTEPPLNPKKNREKMMEIMFDTFNVPASFVAIQGVLGLYSSGRTTGIVLDIGDGVAHTIPIIEGYNISHAMNRYDLAGRDITEYLRKLLEQKGYRFTTSSEKEIIKNIKEKLCYCAIDYDKELNSCASSNITKSYKLPDGNTIYLDTEMFQAPEILFEPGLIGKEYNGIHNTIYDSIQKTDMDLRKMLFSNIVLSGGTTMIKNMDKRLEKELNILKPVKMSNATIYAPPERKYSVWLGGSILCGLYSFKNMWITKKEFDEYGSVIIHKKCM